MSGEESSFAYMNITIQKCYDEGMYLFRQKRS